MKIPVYTEEDEKRFNQILREIQNSVPPGLRKAVVIESPLTPTIKMVFGKALESPDISEEKKKEIQTLLNSGELDKMVYKEDPKIAKQINNYVNRQINKAIKEGRLPPRGHVKYLPSIMKVRNEEKN